MPRTKTQIMSLRALPDLATRVERRAAQEGLTVSAYIRAAVERDLGCPPRPRHRPEFEALHFQLLLCNRYLYRLLADRYGEEDIRAGMDAVKEDVAAQVRAIFDAIDQCEER